MRLWSYLGRRATGASAARAPRRWNDGRGSDDQAFYPRWLRRLLGELGSWGTGIDVARIAVRAGTG